MHLYIYIVIDVLKANILLYWTIFRWSSSMIVKGESSGGTTGVDEGRMRIGKTRRGERWEERRKENKEKKTAKKCEGGELVVRCSPVFSHFAILFRFFTRGSLFFLANFCRRLSMRRKVYGDDNDIGNSEDFACSSTELDHSLRD